MHNQSDLKVNYHSRTFFSHTIRSALLKYVSFAKFLTRERCLWWPSLEAATPPGHPDFQASGILSDGALGRRCYLLIPGDLNNALQLCFQTPSRPRRTAIIFRQLGSADYDLGRRPAPSREESVSLLAIPEWRLHPHIFQEAPMAHAITILQVDNTITLVAPTYLIYVYPQYVSMRAAIVAI